MKTILLGSLAIAAIASACAAQVAGPPDYKVVKAVPLGAPDRWDYVVFDAATQRVYVAHGDHLTVVGARGGEVIGDVKGIPGGTHGIGIAVGADEGFTDDGRNGEAVAFDLKTLAVKAHIAVDKDADAIAFDRASGHVFVVQGDPKKVTAIDPKTNAVVATIDAGGGLEYAVADGEGSLFVAGVEKRDVVKINTATNTVEAHWPIGDCAAPHGAAIDVKNHRLFISCVNLKLVVVDTQSGREITSAPIGKGTDAAAFDPRRKLVFSSNGADGTISVIAQKTPDVYEPVATIKTAVSGRTMSVDPATGRLFVVAADTDPNPTPGARPIVRPGTTKLLFLDPVN